MSHVPGRDRVHHPTRHGAPFKINNFWNFSFSVFGPQRPRVTETTESGNQGTPAPPRNPRALGRSPGIILARVKRVESLATKHEENRRAASFPWRSASSRSRSTWNLLVPEIFLVPPAPAPCCLKVSLKKKKAENKSRVLNTTGAVPRRGPRTSHCTAWGRGFDGPHLQTTREKVATQGRNTRGIARSELA